MSIDRIGEYKGVQPPGKASAPNRTSIRPPARRTATTRKVEHPHLLATPAQHDGGSKRVRTDYVLQLQQTRGNQAVTKMVAAFQRPTRSSSIPSSAGKVQTKLPGTSKGTSAPRQTVASPAQQRLQSAVAEAHASLAEVAEPMFPHAKSAGSRILLNAIREAAKKGRTHLVAATTASIHASATTAERHASTITAAEDKSVEMVHGHVQTSRQTVSEAVDQHTAAVTKTQAAAQQKLASWHGQTSVRAQVEVSKRQDSITAAGAEHAAQIQESGNRAAQTAGSSLTSASADAHSQVVGGGNDERAAGHAEVTDRLGNDTASQLENASGNAQERLRAHAEEATQALNLHTGQASATLGNLTPVLLGNIAETVQGTDTALTHASQQSVAGLQAGNEHAQGELSTVESRAVEVTRAGAAKHREQIHSAGAEAVAGMRRQSGEAVKLAQQHLNVQASRIASSQVDEKTAASMMPALHAQIAKAYAGTTDQAHQVENGASSHLAAAAQEGAKTLARVPTQTATGLATASHSVLADMGRVSGEASKSLSRGVDATITGADAAVSTTAGHLDQAVVQARSGFTSATAAIGKSLDSAVGDVSLKAKDAVGGLHGRIAQGQARVDTFVAQKGPTVQRSILGDIGGWFADQFRDLWNMLKDPAFWVGLVVTLVLVPVMGPGALVIGGLAAGIVSGIEQNVAQGKDWYDPHNIIRNAAIGAIAGAAMALGIGVILGLGLEGLAATAAVMGLSAVIGIVVNLVNGERWDKGLLANLFLAWLFQRIAGGKTPENTPEIKPGGGPEPETPPGRTTTRVPGLYENINPNQSPQGWTFSDTPSTLGNEKIVTTKVTAPDGSTGSMVRGINPATGEFILHSAFLDSIPADVRWIPTDPEMVAGRGIPLETYMTMRQMRILESETGNSLKVTAPRVVRISTIVNTRTVAELAQQVRAGVPADQAILNTHSVQYASNSIVQSGGRIASAHVEGGSSTSAGTVLTPELMSQYGLTASDPVLYLFDITLNIVPADAPQGPPGNRSGPVVPPPVHVPDQDHDGGSQ